MAGRRLYKIDHRMNEKALPVVMNPEFGQA
jgi:hypothetical protein